MTESMWIPGLVVLAIGVIVAFLLGRGHEDSGDDDDELYLAELEAEKAMLIQRIRSAKAAGEDSSRLELEAARVLKAMDQFGTDSSERETIAAESDDTDAGSGRMNPALVGFLTGIAAVGLIGSLIYLAARDAAPRQAGMSATGNAQTEQQLPADHPSVDQSLAAAELLAKLQAAPDDQAVQREVAIGLLQINEYFESFKIANTILTHSPQDIDALFIAGFVRLNMGQADVALGRMEQILAQQPDHTAAQLYRGLSLAEMGQIEEAKAVWNEGIEMAGGSQPQFEELLQMAADGRFAQAEPGEQVATLAPAPAPAPSTTAPAPTAQGAVFPFRVELAAGIDPGNAIVFVSLRVGQGGPPVAVKRFMASQLPIEMSLTSADSMMGGALPGSGRLIARFDRDGAVNTRGDDDHEASIEVTAGQAVTLILGG